MRGNCPFSYSYHISVPSWGCFARSPVPVATAVCRFLRRAKKKGALLLALHPRYCTVEAAAFAPQGIMAPRGPRAAAARMSGEYSSTRSVCIHSFRQPQKSVDNGDPSSLFSHSRKEGTYNRYCTSVFDLCVCFLFVVVVISYMWY